MQGAACIGMKLEKCLVFRQAQVYTANTASTIGATTHRYRSKQDKNGWLCMCRYISTVLGPQYNESPSSCLAEVYKDSSPATPIIFILSQGADPTSSLARCVGKHDVLVDVLVGRCVWLVWMVDVLVNMNRCVGKHDVLVDVLVGRCV
jgi:hypothetical protein